MTKRNHIVFICLVAAISAIALGILIFRIASRQGKTLMLFLATENAETSTVESLLSELDLTIEVSYCSPDSPEYAFRFAAAREQDCDIFILRGEELSLLSVQDIFVELSDFDYGGGFWECGKGRYAFRLSENSAVSGAMLESKPFYLCLSAKSSHVGSYSQNGKGNGDDCALRAAYLLLKEVEDGIA